MDDCILITDARFMCVLGINEEERAQPREVFFDITMFYDIHRSSESDDLKDTIDYRDVHDAIKTLLDDKTFCLIETMASDVAHLILEKFDVARVKVHLKKPSGLADRDVRYTGIVIERSK